MSDFDQSIAIRVDSYRQNYRAALMNSTTVPHEEIVKVMVEVATTAYEAGLREGASLGFAQATTKKSEAIDDTRH